MTRIAFIGLGNMGAPMARNLVQAGHSVHGFDVAAANLAQLVKAGGVAAASAQDAVRGADIVVTMLPAGQHVRGVYLGADGVIATAAKGALLIDCSTIDVQTARETESAAWARDLDFIDAPVSGGTVGADAATLTFMCGGSDRAFTRAQPVLAQMGKTVVHAGGPGNGQAAKICNNMILGISMIAVGEAFNLAAKLGLPLVIDTGRTTIAEVHRAVDTARAAGCESLILQHSPDGHPAPPAAHNLRILETFAQAFGVPTGLSDHYVGVEMLYIAVALGASVLEKGVYLNPEELDQDISHTMALADLPRVLAKVNDCWASLGRPARNPRSKIDWVIGTSQRQCLVAKRTLKAGDRVSLENVRFAFPCKGIPVEHWDLVENWVLAGNIGADQPIQWSHVQQRPVS